jgi:hypothetical protein
VPNVVSSNSLTKSISSASAVTSVTKPTQTPITEARLEDFKGSNLQPLLNPDTHYPGKPTSSSINCHV